MVQLHATQFELQANVRCVLKLYISVTIGNQVTSTPIRHKVPLNVLKLPHYVSPL